MTSHEMHDYPDGRRVHNERTAKPGSAGDCVTDETTPEYFEYLDALRESGATNMFGAGAFLQTNFGLGRQEAGKVLSNWMKTFSERHA